MTISKEQMIDYLGGIHGFIADDKEMLESIRAHLQSAVVVPASHKEPPDELIDAMVAAFYNDNTDDVRSKWMRAALHEAEARGYYLIAAAPDYREEEC